MKLQSISIPQYKGLRNLQVDFCDAQGNVLPICVLAGANGTGKTSLLEYILHSAEGTYPPLPSAIFSNFERHKTIFLPAGNAFFSLVSDLPAFTQGERLRRHTYNIFIDYIDKRIYEDNTPSGEVYAELRQHINDILAVLDLGIEFSRLDRHKTVYFRNRQKPAEEFSIDELSGGEKSIIHRILPFFLADTRDTLILIDEPEDSLHPRWQRQIVDLYRLIAERGNNQFIIATHSPHIVASLEHSCLRIFSRDEAGNVQVKTSSNTFQPLNEHETH